MSYKSFSFANYLLNISLYVVVCVYINYIYFLQCQLNVGLISYIVYIYVRVMQFCVYKTMYVM